MSFIPHRQLKNLQPLLRLLQGDEMTIKFHTPHKTPHGHSFAIDDHGLAIQIDIGQGPQELTGEHAQHLREWLSKAELRTQAQHDAIMAGEEKNPTKEINSGFKVELQKGSNEHVHVATLEEAQALRKKIDAIDAAAAPDAKAAAALKAN